MIFMKNILYFLTVFVEYSDSLLYSTKNITKRKLQLVGVTNNEHGCVTDGGYQWCESTQSCIRQWITPCQTNKNTEYCSNSQPQLCRMVCPPINCPSNNCAMRSGSCCDYSCVTTNLQKNN